MDQRRRPRVSLDLLRGFHAAARHLSFTRAAHELCVTQPAISREVKVLEEQLGQALFRRINRSLQLTPAGQELYHAAEEAFSQLETAIDRIASARRTLAVVTTPALASLWLAPRLPRFNLEHPSIDVRVAASNDRPELERDRLDIAIRFVAAGGDIPEGEPLFDCTSFPVCAPQLLQDELRPLRTPADLARHVQLDYESLRDGRRYSEWDFWFGAMKLRRVAPASRLWFPQYDQLIAAAVEGSGVAVGVVPHVAQHLRQGLLQAPSATNGWQGAGPSSLSAARTRPSARPWRRLSPGYAVRHGLRKSRQHRRPLRHPGASPVRCTSSSVFSRPATVHTAKADRAIARRAGAGTCCGPTR